MTEHTKSALSEAQLRTAYAEGRFVLHYQPQYGSRDRRMSGVEALVRLRDRDGAIIPPSDFIDTIENTSLIDDLGLSLFELACREAARWPSISVAVNVSPAQFKDPNLPAKLINATDRANIDARRVEIEITEGLFFANPAAAEAALTTLSEAGFVITLDDFGTGYSSLGYLLRFPVKKIKIDKSFIVTLPYDVKAVSIVHALVALARALGMKVVAEGVEREDQLRFLQTAGCHVIQGYLFSRPVSATEIDELLLRQSTPDARLLEAVR